MSERVNSDDGTVSWSFLDMEQRVAELFAVSMQKVYGPYGEHVDVVSNAYKGLLHKYN